MSVIEIDSRPDVVEYAIGDVHGHDEHLAAALDWCAADARSLGMGAKIVLLGDYVDRGPDSRGVLERLMAGPAEPDVDWTALAGNHDVVLAEVCRDPTCDLAWEWWAHGGQQTLASFGWDPLRHGAPGRPGDWVPTEIVEFIEAMPWAAVSERCIYVHAGLRPGVDLRLQTRRDLLWIRGDFLKAKADFGRPVVHGHTPEAENPKDHGSRVALDSGCFIGGRLSIAAFEHGKPAPRLHVVTNMDIERRRAVLADVFEPTTMQIR